MRLTNILRRLRASEKGATIVEFALILLPFSVLTMGSLEIGYRIYAQSIVTGSLRDAARMASTGSYTGEQIDTFINERLHDFNQKAKIVIDKRSYSDFTGVGEAEPITSGTVASGTYCFLDINGNGKWDEDQGKAGLGGAEDVIYYQVQMRYATLFPLSIGQLGFPETTMVSANTIASNEPFAAVTPKTPPTLCS
jgi:hypothetical protein